MGDEKTTITAQLDTDLYLKLKSMAEDDMRTVNNFVNWLIREEWARRQQLSLLEPQN